MNRPDKDSYFLGMAREAAKRSTCQRASVGAVIVRAGRILSTGYNGSLPGEPHCIDEGCLMENGHCERTVHAETNAVAQAARFGPSIDGAIVYCWSLRFSTNEAVECCTKCVQLMKAAGIVRIVEGGDSIKWDWSAASE